MIMICITASNINMAFLREDLVGKPYGDHNEVPEFDVVQAMEFPPPNNVGETKDPFGSIHDAEKYLEDRGYMIGSMQSTSPIGFADQGKYRYISKWRNIPKADEAQLDGVILFFGRDEGSLILWFKTPTYGLKHQSKNKTLL